MIDPKILEKLPIDLRIMAIKSGAVQSNESSAFERYKFDPVGYSVDVLGVTPWGSCVDGEVGQIEILSDMNISVRKQIERYEYEINGTEPTVYNPGETIKNWFRVEAGKGVGKTKLASVVAWWLFDCHEAMGYAFAPNEAQINDLLFKEIRSDSHANKLTFGDVLKIPRLQDTRPEKTSHFFVGRATNNSNKKAMASIQGQHEPFTVFIIDESVGVPGFVFSAIEDMTTGGVSIILMLANPQTPFCEFHRRRTYPNVNNYRLSCLNFINVYEGKELIQGATTRQWVDLQIDAECERVYSHNPDENTFEVHWRPGIFKPSNDFMWRVLGRVPTQNQNDTLVSSGVYRAACDSDYTPVQATFASLGIDVARQGNDYGAGYTCVANKVYNFGIFKHKDTIEYFNATKDELVKLSNQGITDVSIRIDGGGGFGGGLVDMLRHDSDLSDMFDSFVVHEVLFNSVNKVGNNRYFEFTSDNGRSVRCKDMVTLMYAVAGERLKHLHVVDDDMKLEAGLTQRTIKTVFVNGVDVVQLLPKDRFRKEFGHSSDRSDGCVLAVCLEEYINASIPRIYDTDDLFNMGFL